MLGERDPQSWVLKALREAGNSLLSELHGLDDPGLSSRPADEDWSLKEIAAHLGDAEELALAQLTAIVEGKGGPLPAWDIDVLPLERDYQAADAGEALSQFTRLRRETTYLLWGLSQADWERAGEHPYRGRVTLGQIARELAQHDLEHLWQARRVKEKLAALVTEEGQA
ncbi:MAG: DinB family protein [Chloroflexi bacterium]|nr:DinB family protein [Chloroflexota bacterium]